MSRIGPVLISTTLLAVSCAQLPIAGLTSNEGGKNPAAHSLTTKGFTYSVGLSQSMSIKANSASGTDDALSLIEGDGHVASYKTDQVVVRTKNGAAIDRVLKKYNAKLLVQEEVSEPYIADPGPDGTPEQRAAAAVDAKRPRKTKKMGNYLIEIPSSEYDQIPSDFVEIANATGIKGENRFSNKRAALTLYKAIKIFKEGKGIDIEAAAPNLVFEPQMATNEGYNERSNNLGNTGWGTSPTSSDFWFAGSSGANFQTASASGNDSWSRPPSVPSWETGGDGSGIKVAVIDNGFTVDGYLNSRIYGYAPVKYMSNAITNSTTMAGPSSNTAAPWHGRQMSALIFGPHNDYSNTLGCAQMATPYIIRTDYTMQSGQQAIDAATNFGCKVINISWGQYNWFLPPQMDPMWYAINTAKNAGVVVVASAGNNGWGRFLPGAYNEVVCVSAHDPWSNICNFFGPQANTLDVDIWAPGDLMAMAPDPTLWADDYYTYNYGGTSGAAALTSGVLAVCFEKGRITDHASAMSRIQSKGTVRGGNSLLCLNAMDMIYP